MADALNLAKPTCTTFQWLPSTDRQTSRGSKPSIIFWWRQRLLNWFLLWTQRHGLWGFSEVSPVESRWRKTRDGKWIPGNTSSGTMSGINGCSYNLFSNRMIHPMIPDNRIQFRQVCLHFHPWNMYDYYSAKNQKHFCFAHTTGQFNTLTLQAGFIQTTNLQTHQRSLMGHC